MQKVKSLAPTLFSPTGITGDGKVKKEKDGAQ